MASGSISPATRGSACVAGILRAADPAVKPRASPARPLLSRAPPSLPRRTRLAYRAQLRVGLLLPGSLVPRLLALKWRLRPLLSGD